MPEAVIVNEAAPIEGTQPAAPSAEAVAAAGETAVAVAEIEGSTRVAEAEIRAETDQAAIAASAEAAAANNGDSEWRRNIESRVAQSEARGEEILSTLRKLTEPPQSPPPPSESDGATPGNQEAPEPKPKPKKPFRLI